ncbi:MAG: response regulator [Ignavibacteriales bacterium]|nr:response regulator [Ignavibacteriales bacterium]
MAESILVVDDDNYIRVILQKRLSTAGYNIRVAVDGVAGLAAAKESQPDLIISDWTMPNMDGLELCRTIKNDEFLRYAYFILLTAKDTQDDKIEAIEGGADDYLTKPFNDRELMARVRAGLRIGRLQKEISSLQHEKAVTELAVTLGHEINNPLGIMMLMLQVIQRKDNAVPLSEIQKEIETCLTNGKRMAEIVKKLSTLESPQYKPYLKNSGTNMLDLSQS